MVTGAGFGIGKSVAQSYAAKGAKVLIAEIDIALGKQTEGLILTNGGQAIFVHTDVSKETDIKELIEKTVKEYGSVDILINNAGVSKWESIFELEVSFYALGR